jgi:hypothetical protein
MTRIANLAFALLVALALAGGLAACDDGGDEMAEETDEAAEEMDEAAEEAGDEVEDATQN